MIVAGHAFASALTLAALLSGCDLAPTRERAGTAPCIDAIADARRRLGDDGRIDVGRVSASDGPDLDGDGSLDIVVDATGACGSGGCDHQLYVRRGACARYVGSLTGNEVVPTGARHRGFADVETSLYAGSTNWGEVRASLHDDGEYRADVERSCEAPASEQGDEAAPVCSPWLPADTKGAR